MSQWLEYHHSGGNIEQKRVLECGQSRIGDRQRGVKIWISQDYGCAEQCEMELPPPLTQLKIGSTRPLGQERGRDGAEAAA